MYTYALFLVVIIILIYNANDCSVREYEDYMTGIWRGDPGFCAGADLSSMMLYVGGRSDTSWFGSRIRECYLIMNNDICNQSITLSYSRGSSGFCSVGKYEITAHVKYEDEAVMPETVTMEFDMRSGVLRIHNDTKLYGVLWKDAEMSMMAEQTVE